MGGCIASSLLRLLGLPAPLAGDSPSVGLGRQATHLRGLTGAEIDLSWSIRDLEEAEARGTVDPVRSPARSFGAEHLTRSCSPPRRWNAIGSRQLVTVTRAKNPLLGVAVLPVN